MVGKSIKAIFLVLIVLFNFRVSINNSKWSNGDISIQYKPIEYQIGNGFSLPLQNLCLVIPVKISNDIFQEGNDYLLIMFHYCSYLIPLFNKVNVEFILYSMYFLIILGILRDFFIVPMEDIINLTEIGDKNTINYNNVDSSFDNNTYFQQVLLK